MNPLRLEQMTVFDVEPAEVVTLAEAYRAWVRFLYRVVELENALVNDFSVHGLPLTDQEKSDEVTPLKSALFAETIDRVGAACPAGQEALHQVPLPPQGTDDLVLGRDGFPRRRGAPGRHVSARERSVIPTPGRAGVTEPDTSE